MKCSSLFLLFGNFLSYIKKKYPYRHYSEVGDTIFYFMCDLKSADCSASEKEKKYVVVFLFAFLFIILTIMWLLNSDALYYWVTDRCNCNVMTVACYFKTVYQFNLQFTANCWLIRNSTTRLYIGVITKKKSNLWFGIKHRPKSLRIITYWLGSI